MVNRSGVICGVSSILSTIVVGTDHSENPVERRKLIATAGILISQQISGVQFIFSYTTTFFTLVGLDDTFIITVSQYSVKMI